MILIFINQRFNGLIGHNHHSIPWDIHQQGNRQGTVKGEKSFLLKHIIEQLEIRLIAKYLTSLFECVEGSHDEIMKETSDASTNRKQQRTNVFVHQDYLFLIELVHCEKSSMGWATTLGYQGSSFPEGGHSSQEPSTFSRVVYDSGNLQVGFIPVFWNLGMRFYIIKR